MNDRALAIDDRVLSSRFFLGTAQYPSPDILRQSIKAANPGLITVSIRRESASGNGQKFWDIIKDLNVLVLPNTAGCLSANEAINTAEMAREIFETNWIKLEVIGNDYTLEPEPQGLTAAAEELNKRGFKVFPYMTDDLTLAENLVKSGCDILMPWGAPIGSGRGLQNIEGLKILREKLPNCILVVDAGLGTPSHAAQAMELGYDAVLVNTAVAKSTDPVNMAKGFAKGVKAGRFGYLSGLIAPQENASASTPMIDRPFWHQVKS